MSWLAPISPLQLGGLLALAVALLLFLHLRTRRPQRLRVPFLAAWDEVASAHVAYGARLAPARSWALARALLIAAALAFALSDPQPEWLVGAPRTTLIVLDAGAHMQAREAVGSDRIETRFEHARALAERAARDHAALGDVLVAQLDSTLAVLSNVSRDPTQLSAAVGRARVSYEPTRFGALTAFARERLRGMHAELILISDGAFELAATDRAQLQAAGVNLRQLRVGASAENIAVRSFAVRAYAWDAQRCEARVDVENYDARERSVELTLLEHDRPIAVEPVRLPAGGRVTRSFALTASGSHFSARILPNDAGLDRQPIDDVAYAVLAQPPTRRVLLVTSGLRYLEDALALDPRLAVDRVAPDAYRSADGYALAIFDRFVPRLPPTVPSLWFAPNAARELGGAPYRVTGSVERPFFDDVETDHPLLRAVSLHDVNIQRAQRVKLESGDRALASSQLTPLVVSGTRSGQRFIALTFDVRESDLVLRTAWPIFVSHAVSLLTAADASFESPLTLGRTELRSVALAGTPTAVLNGPNGERRTLPVRDGRVALTLALPGFYELSAVGERRLLAANVDTSAASRIAPRRFAPEPEAARASSPLRAANLSVSASLLVLALLVLAIDASRVARWGRT